MTVAERPAVPTLRPSDAVNLAGSDTGRDHLSHSKVAIFLACQRKFQLHYETRLERVDKGPARSMGKAFQRAIELADPERVHGEMLAAAAELTGGRDEYDRLRVQAATVRCGAELYLEKWPAPVCDACGGDRHDHGVQAPERQVEPCPSCGGSGVGQKREVEFLVQLRNPWTGHYSRTFDLKGYADGVEDKGTHLELIENKFVGQITNVGVRKLILDQQISLEAYGLWRATGKAVREVRYRYVRKPSIKQKQGETVDGFITRLEDDYRARADDFYSHEETLFRTDEDLLRVEAELWAWAEQLRQLRRAPIFPRNTQSCSDFGGCDFLPICAGEPDARALFQVRPVQEEDTRAATD